MLVGVVFMCLFQINIQNGRNDKKLKEMEKTCNKENVNIPQIIVALNAKEKTNLCQNRKLVRNRGFHKEAIYHARLINGYVRQGTSSSELLRP